MKNAALLVFVLWGCDSAAEIDDPMPGSTCASYGVECICPDGRPACAPYSNGGICPCGDDSYSTREGSPDPVLAPEPAPGTRPSVAGGACSNYGEACECPDGRTLCVTGSFDGICPCGGDSELTPDNVPMPPSEAEPSEVPEAH